MPNRIGSVASKADVGLYRFFGRMLARWKGV